MDRKSTNITIKVQLAVELQVLCKLTRGVTCEDVEYLSNQFQRKILRNIPRKIEKI